MSLAHVKFLSIASISHSSGDHDKSKRKNLTKKKKTRNKSQHVTDE